MIRYERHPDGRRCFVAGTHRLHHGLVGALLIFVGLLLAWEDRRDLRVWIPDFLAKATDERRTQ